MSEDDLLTAVLDLCKVLHLMVHHCRPARTERGWRTPIAGDAGFCDVVIVGGNGVLFRELKGEKGRLSAAQTLWLSRLAFAKADAGVWRPSDLRSGLVLEELKAVT